MHWQVLCKARCLNFGLNLYLRPFYVCASSKGTGEAAYMHRQSEHGLIKYWITIKSRMSWPISLLNNHFLIKSSRSSLFPIKTNLDFNKHDFNNRNLFLTAKLLKQGYRYHKIRKAFSKFYYRHSELIVKYNIGLKLFCNKAYQNLYFMVI